MYTPVGVESSRPGDTNTQKIFIGHGLRFADAGKGLSFARDTVTASGTARAFAADVFGDDRFAGISKPCFLCMRAMLATHTGGL